MWGRVVSPMIRKETQLKVWVAIMLHSSKGCKKCRTIIDDVAIAVDDNCLKEMKLID